MSFDTMTGISVLLLIVAWAIYKRITGKSSSSSRASSGASALGNLPDDVAQWYGPVKRFAGQYNIPWQLVIAQLWQESRGDPEAMGSSGEIGLMQIKEIAYRDLVEHGYDVPDDWKYNPISNIHVGVAYLDLMRERSDTLIDAVGRVKADAFESYNEGYSNAVKDVELDDYTSKVIQKAKQIGYNV